jgi:hypothetical protein
MLLTVVGLVAAANLVMAQAPKTEARQTPKTDTKQAPKTEAKKPVKATLRLTSDVKFGDKVLRAGEYQVKCDGETIEFTQSTNRDRDAETYKFPCQGDELSAASDRTQLSTMTDANGVAVAQKLLIKGSNVQHIFS